MPTGRHRDAIGLLAGALAMPGVGGSVSLWMVVGVVLAEFGVVAAVMGVANVLGARARAVPDVGALLDAWEVEAVEIAQATVSEGGYARCTTCGWAGAPCQLVGPVLEVGACPRCLASASAKRVA